MFGAVAGELKGGSESVGLEALWSPAAGSPMQLGGDVRGQAHNSFLLLLCILLKYARHVIFHFLVACVDAVRLELPRLKTVCGGKKVVQTKKDSRKSPSQKCDDETNDNFHILSQIKGKIRIHFF